MEGETIGALTVPARLSGSRSRNYTEHSPRECDMVQRPLTLNDLLNAIRQDPEADEPRLAYAEWLDDHHQPLRAEYLRLALALERPESRLLPGSENARRRMNDLLRLHLREWVAEHSPLPGVRWVVHRGLFEHVWFDGFLAFDSHHHEVFQHPVTRVGIYKLRSPERFFRSPALQKIRGLDLRNCSGLGPNTLQLLAESPYVSQLRWLALPGNVCHPQSLRVLALSPHLTQLRGLTLGGYYGNWYNDNDDEGIVSLASSPTLTQLTTLDLGRMTVRTQGMRRFFESRNFANLKTLDLGKIQISPLALEALGDGSGFASLENLDLSSCQLGDDGLAILANARCLDRLQTLNLDRNLIGNEGARHLASATHLRSLLRLSLSGNAIGTRGLHKLLEADHLACVHGLELSGNLLGDDALRALAATTKLPKLRTLILDSVPAHHETVQWVQSRFRDAMPPVSSDERPANVSPSPMFIAGPTPSDEDRLLQAILSAPEDPLPRLAYADWLEEQGETVRAQLLRLGANADPEWVAHSTPTIPPELTRAVHHARFDRGLLTVQVQMRGFLAKSFQKVGPHWLNAVRCFQLDLHGSTINWAKVAAMPSLAQVRMLRLEPRSLSDLGLKCLLDSPHFGRLFGLDLTGNSLNQNTRLQRLLQATTIPNLCYLVLADNHLGLERIRDLAAWRPQRRLTSLNLAWNWVGSNGLALLAGSEFSSELTQLDLRHNSLPDQAIHALLESPYLSRLTHLWLGSNNLGDAAIRILSRSPFLQRLQHLDIGYNRISGETVLNLIRSPYFNPACRLQLHRPYFLAGVVERLQALLGGRLMWY